MESAFSVRGVPSNATPSAAEPNCPIAPVFSRLPLSFCCFSLAPHRLLVLGEAVPMHQPWLWLAQDGDASRRGDFLAWQDKIWVGCNGERAGGQRRALLVFAVRSPS